MSLHNLEKKFNKKISDNLYNNKEYKEYKEYMIPHKIPQRKWKEYMKEGPQWDIPNNTLDWGHKDDQQDNEDDQKKATRIEAAEIVEREKALKHQENRLKKEREALQQEREALVEEAKRFAEERQKLQEEQVRIEAEKAVLEERRKKLEEAEFEKSDLRELLT